MNPQVVEESEDKVTRIRKALDSIKGHELALKLIEVDDFTMVIYQGLRTNVWGRLQNDRITIYNMRLRRLLERHPATRDLELF